MKWEKEYIGSKF
uniref:Uncharacterized protein n=1 Tax=Arundo donax TaxID=35708 RepID=A0A0A9BJM7_ARUDO